MNLSAKTPASDTPAVIAALTPLLVVVLLVFLVIGIALPVLPLHVHQRLGFGTFIVGLVSGSQFASAFLSRIWAGHFTDRNGPKQAVTAGVLAAALAGLLYLLSLRFVGSPVPSVSILLIGRALLGAAESFIITGAVGWGFALVTPQHTGRVIAWVGTALFAAFAVGAPLGSIVYEAKGFVAIALVTTVLPLAGLALVSMLSPVIPSTKTQPPLTTVLGAVAAPGIGLAFTSLGFGAMTTFVTLLFVSRGWSPVWLPLSLFAAAFMTTRIVFGHLPDRFGGARVAFVSILLNAAGLALIWWAPTASLALAGGIASGLGYALVYPGLGLEAVKAVPSQSRALAMGTYTAFLDLALGLTTPLLGLVAGHAGLRAVFLASSVSVLCAAPIALRLRRVQP